MDPNSIQQSASEGFVLADVLHVLSSDAREVLVAALRSGSSLPSARLSCRALRDLIDIQQTTVTVDTAAVSYADLVTLCQEGRWLRRWPRCTQVNVIVVEEEFGALAAPFLAAPLEACQRITELTVNTTESQSALPGSHFLALVSRLPAVCKLVLSTIAPDLRDDPLESSLMQLALSMLPRLTDLTADWSYLACIPSSLGGQLTRLELTSQIRAHRPPAAEVAAALPGMTAVCELVFTAAPGRRFTPAEVLELLNAAPPSLTRMQVDTVEAEGVSLSFTFSNSVLNTVHVNTSSTQTPQVGTPRPPTYADVAARLAAMVLPSRALGPRLSVLGVSHLTLDGSLSNPDPATALLARCAGVELGVLRGSARGSREGAMSLMRKLGVPRSLEWDAGRGLWATVSLAEPKLRAAKRRPVLEPGTVVERVAQRLASSAGTTGSILLLRGPFMRGLLALPKGLRATLRHLGRAAGSSLQPCILSCRALPAAGAVALEFRSLAVAEAAAEEAAEAARRLADAVSGVPEAAGVVLLEVLRPGVTLETAIQQELQALWDGEGEGEEVAGATNEEQDKADTGAGGGAGLEAGAAGGSSGDGGGRGTAASELERVQWLLETWEGLRAWISDVDVVESHA